MAKDELMAFGNFANNYLEKNIGKKIVFNIKSVA